MHPLLSLTPSWSQALAHLMAVLRKHHGTSSASGREVGEPAAGERRAQLSAPRIPPECKAPEPGGARGRGCLPPAGLGSAGAAVAPLPLRHPCPDALDPPVARGWPISGFLHRPCWCPCHGPGLGTAAPPSAWAHRAFSDGEIPVIFGGFQSLKVLVPAKCFLFSFQKEK